MDFTCINIISRMLNSLLLCLQNILADENAEYSDTHKRNSRLYQLNRVTNNHCSHVPGVIKELWSYAATNFISELMLIFNCGDTLLLLEWHLLIYYSTLWSVDQIIQSLMLVQRGGQTGFLSSSPALPDESRIQLSKCCNSIIL